MQLRRQVLPALVKLANDGAIEVRLAAIEALASVWQLSANTSSLLEDLHRQLDTIMSSGVHEVSPVPPYPWCCCEKLLTILISKLQHYRIYSARTHKKQSLVWSPQPLTGSAVRLQEAAEQLHIQR